MQPRYGYNAWTGLVQGDVAYNSHPEFLYIGEQDNNLESVQVMWGNECMLGIAKCTHSDHNRKDIIPGGGGAMDTTHGSSWSCCGCELTEEASHEAGLGGAERFETEGASAEELLSYSLADLFTSPGGKANTAVAIVFGGFFEDFASLRDAIFSFFRYFSIPSSHICQNSQASPLLHPPCFQ